MARISAIPVNTFREHAWCEKCEGGELLPTGVALTGILSKYQHKCSGCGHEEMLEDCYPRLFTMTMQ